MLANYSIPEHPLYKDFSKLEFPEPTDKVRHIKRCSAVGKTPTAYSITTKLTGEFEDGELIDLDIIWDFQNNIERASSHLISMLQLFSCVYASTLCKDSKNFTFDSEWYNLDTSEWKSILHLWKDLNWQLRLSHFWAALTIDETEPTSLVKILSSFVEDQPYEDYFQNYMIYSDFIPKLTSLDNVCLSMSFGKESLLSLLMLRQFFPKEISKLTFSAIKHSAVFQNVDLALLDKLNDVLGTNFEMSLIHSNLKEKFEILDQRNVTGFVPCMQIAQFIGSGKTTLVYGDEYERTYVDHIKYKDQSFPVYTMDYPQSTVWHAKMNHLMQELDLPYKQTSVLFNLNELQIQKLLVELEPKVARLQTSCWHGTDETPWCNECFKCFRIAFMRKALRLQLPKGLNPPNFKRKVSEVNSRSAFSIDMLDTNTSPVKEMLDKNFTTALSILIGFPDRLDLGSLQPSDSLHPNLLKPEWRTWLEEKLFA